MINLQDFCGDENSSFRLATPFSKGEWSYATNGHILIRVPLIAGLREDGPNADKMFEVNCKNIAPPSITFAVELPPLETQSEECSECDGTGNPHDCPACECKCDECDGRGSWDVSSDKGVSVAIGGVPFGCGLIRLLMTLPALRIAPPQQKKALYFAFDGGDGLLMPLTKPHETNIAITL